MGRGLLADFLNSLFRLSACNNLPPKLEKQRVILQELLTLKMFLVFS
jgi:hypothetical protein